MSEVKCLKCGASTEKLILDVRIIAAFTLDSKGHISNPRLNQEDLINQAKEEGEDYKRLYCQECGHYMGVKTNDDGAVIEATETVSDEWK